MMLGNDGIKDSAFRERDMICLSLDGFRRAARLCCTLGKATFFTLIYNLIGYVHKSCFMLCIVFVSNRRRTGIIATRRVYRISTQF